jgi:hypothetical protein
MLTENQSTEQNNLPSHTMDQIKTNLAFHLEMVVNKL